MVAKTVLEKTEKQESVTPKYTAQSTDIGHNGLLMENAASHATKEHTTEPEPVLERNMVAKTVLEIQNNMANVTPKLTVHQMVHGQAGLNMENAASLVAKEHISVQEPVLERNMVAKIVLETPKNLVSVTPMFIVEVS